MEKRSLLPSNQAKGCSCCKLKRRAPSELDFKPGCHEGARLTFCLGVWRWLSRLTWGDCDAVAVDNGLFLLLLLGGLDAGLFHVAHWLVTLPLALGARSGARQQLVCYIEQQSAGLGRRLWGPVEIICGIKRSALVTLFLQEHVTLGARITAWKALWKV